MRTWVLENGYNRPDWITLEPTGVNAYSCMPRDARAYRDVDLDEPAEESPRVGLITPYHTVNITSYFTGVVLGTPLFPTYRYPYAVPLWPQIFGHIRRYGVWLMRQNRWNREALAVMADPRPFFVACLQREGDSQLIEHSDLKTNAAFMTQVIANFAKAAPRDHRLVFKNHPLDPGVDDLAAAATPSPARPRSPTASSSWRGVPSHPWRAPPRAWWLSTRRRLTRRWASACR